MTTQKLFSKKINYLIFGAVLAGLILSGSIAADRCAADGRYFKEGWKFPGFYPKGFDGYHCYEVEEIDSDHTFLKHTLEMNAKGFAILSWTFIFHPLRDALIENSLDKAEKNLGISSEQTNWSTWVKFLRWAFK